MRASRCVTDVDSMTYLSLYSGAGGADLCCQHLLGMDCAGYVEVDGYCREVLQARQRDGVLGPAPVFGDVYDFVDREIEEWLMWLSEGFRVRRGRMPGNAWEWRMIETCGPLPADAFAWLDRVTCSWKTCRPCGGVNMATSDEYLETWPRAGMMCGGVSFRRPNWERRINEIGSGLLPTLLARDCRTPKGAARSLAYQGGDSLVVVLGETIHPEWAEMFMGWPIGWTGLEPLGGAGFRSWGRRHGIF